jgi:hypothetical protein
MTPGKIPIAKGRGTSGQRPLVAWSALPRSEESESKQRSTGQDGSTAAACSQAVSPEVPVCPEAPRALTRTSVTSAAMLVSR